MKTSICVCTADRPRPLERLLGALAGIDLEGLDPGSLEVLVIDNHPNGSAKRIAERMAPGLPIPIRVEEEPQRGIPFARNAAVQSALAAGADFVAFIDDDDVPEPDWLRRLLERQQETGASIVFGTWLWHAPEDATVWVRASPLMKTGTDTVIERYGVEVPEVWMSTCNALISRQVLEEMTSLAPPFAPEFASTGGGDADFFVRGLKLGASFSMETRSVVKRYLEDERAGLRWMLRRAYRLGCSSGRLTRKHSPGDEVSGTRREACSALLREPLRILRYPFSRKRTARSLYRISRAAGVRRGLRGLEFDYYPTG